MGIGPGGFDKIETGIGGVMKVIKEEERRIESRGRIVGSSKGYCEYQDMV